MLQRRPIIPETPGDGQRTEGPGAAMARELVELYFRQICINEHVCLREAMRRLERDIILYVLGETNGNQHEAAETLGIKPTTLNYRLHRLGITPVHRYGLEGHPGPH